MKLELFALPFLLSTALLVGCQTPEATTPDAAPDAVEQPNGGYPEEYPEGADPTDAEGADPAATDAPADAPTTP
jgi:hypothetical protein